SYGLAHAALARAWSTLGFDASAVEEARKAMNYAGGVNRGERLWIDGVYRETTNDWAKAIDAYQALFDLFPDRVDYGLRLADCQVAGGRAREAFRTAEALRSLPEPDRSDPNIDLVEAAAAQSLSDFA